MRTKIIIRHDDVAALKSHPLWQQLMNLFMNDGAVVVDEISKIDADDETELQSFVTVGSFE